jgi:HSP20 family protein
MNMLWSDVERFGGFLDPWRDFERINKALSRFTPTSRVEFPAVNVWVTGDNAVLTTEISGISPEDIDISLMGSTLTLRGSRQTNGLKEGETYHRRERWYGNFAKTIELPFNIEASKVDARTVNGVLYITLPRAEAEKPKKIAVKST